VPQEKFFAVYSALVCNLWDILYWSIDQERKKRKEPGYMRFFEELAKDATAYRTRKEEPPITTY
jgi:hypothetical protein